MCGSDGSPASQITHLRMGNLRMEMLLKNLPEVLILAQQALLKLRERRILFFTAAHHQRVLKMLL